MNKKELLNRAPLWHDISSTLLLPFMPAGAIPNNALSFQRRRKVKGNKKAAVLSSQAFYHLPIYFGATVIPGMINDYFTHNMENYPEWKFFAKGDDLIKVLRDPSYDSIALIGHGDRKGWEAADRYVDRDEVKEAFGDLPKKEGSWLQITCGDDSKDIPMGFDVMKNPKSNCLFYTHTINMTNQMWSYLPDRNANHIIDSS
jgi:hypothetical protein